MEREPYWDYMSRRLREEESMFNSLHLKLDDTEKRTITTEVDLMKKEIYQLQKSLQESYKRIKVLNETIRKQHDKIFRLEKLMNKEIYQLEFEF
jgi:peptidoglycan hydrolase CwlO-like protein